MSFLSLYILYFINIIEIFKSNKITATGVEMIEQCLKTDYIQ